MRLDCGIYMFAIGHDLLVLPGTCSSRHMFFQAHVLPGTCSSRHMFFQAHVLPGTCSSRHM